MCGIAGIINSKLSPEETRETLTDMLSAIKHRGPDASKIHVSGNNILGHNRLSIIDLDTRSDQPFYYKDLVLTYNGEIYNYKELRKELAALGHEFLTSSDTEVLIHAYHEWGESCLHKFIGMWSFVILNSRTGDVFGSRDRFGIKPLYYIHENGTLNFASEIKALRRCREYSSELNPAQMARYLQLGWIELHSETLFKKIKCLPAAHNFHLRNGMFSVERYYDLELGVKLNKISFEEKCHEFRNLFNSSIKYHLRSDVQVATCLSGGIDSSAIVSLVQDLNPDTSYNSYSIYYTGSGEVDERPFINAVLKKYPNVKGNFYEPTIDEVKEHFENALNVQDVPPPSTSFLSQYFLMKMISEDGIKVVLDGQGSDEYLAGYMHSFYRLAADHIRSFNFQQAYRELRFSNRNREGGSLVKESAKTFLSLLFEESTLYDLEYRFYEPAFTNYPGVPDLGIRNKAGGSLDNFLYNLIYTSSLPNLLHFEDHNSMAFSIESRVPFLDHRLVEFGFQLSNSDKISNGVTKYILRESLKGVIPEKIYSRSDKKGFVTPQADWESILLKSEEALYKDAGNFQFVNFIRSKWRSKIALSWIENIL